MIYPFHSLPGKRRVSAARRELFVICCGLRLLAERLISDPRGQLGRLHGTAMLDSIIAP